MRACVRVQNRLQKLREQVTPVCMCQRRKFNRAGRASDEVRNTQRAGLDESQFHNFDSASMDSARVALFSNLH